MKPSIAFVVVLVAGLATAAIYPPTEVQNAATGQLMNLGRHGECKLAMAAVAGTALTLTDGGVKQRSSVSIQNQTSGETLYCTFDGVTVPTTTRGIAITTNAMYSDNLTGEVNVQCICSRTSADCVVAIQECK